MLAKPGPSLYTQYYRTVHLVHHDMPCDPNLVSSAFYTSLYSLSKLQIFHLLVSLGQSNKV